VEINLEQIGYTVSEGSLGVEICIRVTGGDTDTDTLSTYICTEGDTAMGMRLGHHVLQLVAM
jgi:hypothetical protein